MTQPLGASWSQSAPLPTMGAMADEDFSAFLDLDNIDLDFPMFETSGDPHSTQHSCDEETSAEMRDQPIFLGANQYHGNPTAIPQQHSGLHLNPVPSKSIMEAVGLDKSSTYFHQHTNFPMLSEQTFQSQPGIPVTPNSAEMYPEVGLYLQQMEWQRRSMMVPSYQYRKENTTITPMLSPEMGTNESAFSFIPDYPIPDAYSLSPLTSPAMNPQNNNNHTHVLLPARTADSSLAASPIELGFDLSGDVLSSLNERPRKSRRKGPTATTMTARRQTSATNLRKRRGSLSLKTMGRDSSGLLQQTSKLDDAVLQPSSDRVTLVGTRQDAQFKSIAPVPLSEPLMAPPRKPNSTTIVASRPNDPGLPPATPASLMRIQQKPSPITTSLDAFDGAQPDPGPRNLRFSMEDLKLPEAATQSTGSQDTPQINPRGLERGGPGGSTMSRGQRSGLTSPTRHANGSKPHRRESGRGSRKRNSTSSAMPSPALIPKISPSIRPQLPEGTNALDSTHAMILASKSNYQHILEGTHLPGVSYPSELTNTLSSKRTSHKLAEQGRRNRINTALQEMQTLLPSPLGDPAGTDFPQDGGDANASPLAEGETCSNGARTPSTPTLQGNSKAATVELAINYIKTLNSKLADKESENEILKSEMKALREKLLGGDAFAGLESR